MMKKKKTEIIWFTIILILVIGLGIAAGIWLGKITGSSEKEDNRGKTQKSSISRKPEKSVTPELQPTPKASDDSTETVTPNATKDPVGTETPALTKAPAATATPALTKAPAATATPVLTKAPAVTATPGLTKAPAATATPVLTKAPAATATPVLTKAPAATATPVLTKAPAATVTPAVTKAPTATPKITKAPEKTEGYQLTVESDNNWNNGNQTVYGLSLGIGNNTSQDINGWTVVLTVEGLGEVDGWNGKYSEKANTLTITNENYNALIHAGGTLKIGCNLGTTAGSLKITKALLNGKPMQVVYGKVTENNQGQQGGENPAGQDSGNKDQNQDKVSKDALSDKEVKERLEKAVAGDDWLHTDGNRILDKDGKQVWLTGVNWFGYNTGTNTFDGLWNSMLAPTVKSIADHGFNLIRVPISAELINQWADGVYPKANYNNASNPDLNGKNSLEIWDYFLSLAKAYGIKVMPDIHSAETNASGHNVNLWYTDKVTVQDYYRALEWMAKRYKNDDTIIAFDLKNEPHGKPYEKEAAAIWNDSKANNNWKMVAETAASKILAQNPNVLIMVEGIEIYPIDLKKNADFHSTNDKDYFFNWWGGNLRGVKDFPVNLGKYQNKLVYSPHDYGPTVFLQPWFEKEYDYDSLMKDCWHDNWFYIYEEDIAPLLIGEWGGFMTEPNITWMTYMRELIGKYHLNHTFWCLNANSGDTGGLLLDDFKTWDDEKYNFVKEVLWQQNGKFVGLDHKIKLGENGISLGTAKGADW